MEKSILRFLVCLATASLAIIFICGQAFAVGGKGNVQQLGERMYIWHFDEGQGEETEDSTIGLVGVIEGDATWAEGVSGKSLELSSEVGSPQYVELPHSDEIDIDEQITMAAWIYPNSLPTGGQENKFTIIYKNTYYMQLEPGDGEASKISYYFYEAVPPGYHLSDGTVKAEEWTHIAVVWDGKEASFYINGKKDSSIAQTGVGKSDVSRVLRLGAENTDC